MNRFLYQILLFISISFVLSLDAIHIIIHNKTQTSQNLNFEYRLDQLYNHSHKKQIAFVPHTTNHVTKTIAPHQKISFSFSSSQTCTKHYCILDDNLKNDGFIPNKKRINILLSTFQETLFHESSLIIKDNQTITCTLLKNKITVTLT